MSQPLLDQTSDHLVDDDAIVAALQTEMSRALGRPCRIAQMQRWLSEYYSSYVMEEIDLVLESGERFELIFKNLSCNAILEGAAKTKPFFLYNPLREIDAYRTVLAPDPIGAPRFFGAHVDPASQEFWLFIERVPGTLLWQFGEDEMWQYVAGWLGGVHAQFRSHAERIEEADTSNFKRLDRHYYWQWISRAQAFVRRSVIGDFCDPTCNIDWLAERFDVVIERLSSLPITFIHGEFYPANVLVRKDGDDIRVCPVDWETASVGPGLLDLSAMTSGNWTEPQRIAMARAYFDAVADSSDAAAFDEFLVDLDYCNLFMAVQWLGWAPGWEPPPEHANNWLTEACRLARKLDL